MKILICGSRFWTKRESIKKELEKFSRDTIIIHGACKGADSLAGYIARRLGFTNIQEYPADWKQYGKGAGSIRNRKMLKENPDTDLVLAFHENIENSKGTKDMLAVAEAAGIEYKLISE
jgi:hypothetical protein